MKKMYYYLSITLIWGLSSCHDFLNTFPKEYVYATSIADFDELLAGEGYMFTGEVNNETGVSAFPYFLHIMDDDVKANASLSANGTVTYGGFYTWQEEPFGSFSGLLFSQDKDDTWGKFYKGINVLNVVLDEVEKFREEDSVGYRRIKGEAYFLRAGYYWGLANIYAKPYVAETAEADLGIPLKLGSVVVDEPYMRKSLKETYECIVNDLQLAITHLKGIEQPSVYRVNETAARALLSRVYLYMQEWELANKECDTILANGGYDLLDYNRLTTNSSTVYAGSPEVIFSQGEYRHSIMEKTYNANCSVSDDLLDALSMEGEDLRKTYGFKTKGAGEFFPNKLKKWADGGVSDCFVIRWSEIYLNKAEALAMLGENEQEANDLIWNLREKRFKTGTVQRGDKTGKDLIDLIRNERRFELCFEGHRWFDLRRYAVNKKYPLATTITHDWRYRTDDGHFVVYFVLNPYPEDMGWVIPLPTDEIIINEGALLDNEKRPAREYVEQL